MAGDIKQKIVLEGEKEYNAAIKEAQRNLKVLRSELKAETAELGKNATAQQQNEAKVKSLQKQIKEQEKIVRTYEDALKQVKAQYGDNEEAIARWEIKLNDARTALANMKNGLDSTGASMAKVTGNAQMGVVAANSLADAFAKIGNAGSVISGALEDAFTGVTDRVRDIIADVWESIVDLAARSNGLVDLAGFWGTDVNTIQRYKGAVSEASATLEDLNSIVTKINSGDAKKITELTKVSKVDFKDQWKYAMAVMDAMSQMSTEERNAAGFQIFGGRQATKAFDLLNDWATVQANLDKYDREQGGYGLTTEEMQTMSELYDKVNGLRESWGTLKDMALVHLTGDLAMNITGNIQEIVDAFKDYFMADNDSDRAAALNRVKENVIEIFENIRDGIEAGLKVLGEIAQELQGSGDPILEAMGKALEVIVSAFEWIANPDNWGAVKTAFETLIGIWAGAKVTTALSNLAGFAANIGTIMLAKGLGGGKELIDAAAGAGSGTATAAAASGGGFMAGLGAAGKKALEFLGGTGGKILGGAGAFLATLLTPAATDGDYYDESGVLRDKNGHELVSTNVGSEIALDQSVVAERKMPLTRAQMEAMEAFWDAWRQDDIEMTPTTNEKFIEAWDAYEAAFAGQEHLFDKVDQLLTEFQSGAAKSGEWPYMEDLPASFWEDAGGISEADLQGFRNVPNQMAAAVQRGAAAGVSGIQVIMDAERVGRLVAPYVSQGIARDVLISPV